MIKIRSRIFKITNDIAYIVMILNIINWLNIEITNDSLIRLPNIFLFVFLVFYGLSCYCYVKYEFLYKKKEKLQKHRLMANIYTIVKNKQTHNLSFIRVGRCFNLLLYIEKFNRQMQFYIIWQLIFIITSCILFILWNIFK